MRFSVLHTQAISKNKQLSLQFCLSLNNSLIFHSSYTNLQCYNQSETITDPHNVHSVSWSSRTCALTFIDIMGGRTGCFFKLSWGGGRGGGGGRWTICPKNFRKLPKFLGNRPKATRVIRWTNVGLPIRWRYFLAISAKATSLKTGCVQISLAAQKFWVSQNLLPPPPPPPPPPYTRPVRLRLIWVFKNYNPPK